MKLYIKILLLTIACLMLSACGKSVENKLIGKWEGTIDGDLTVWTFTKDFTLTMTGGPPQSLEWELFEELSKDPSLILLAFEKLDRGPDLEIMTTIEFLEDNKLLLNNIGNFSGPGGPDEEPLILTKLGK